MTTNITTVKNTKKSLELLAQSKGLGAFFLITSAACSQRTHIGLRSNRNISYCDVHRDMHSGFVRRVLPSVNDTMQRI